MPDDINPNESGNSTSSGGTTTPQSPPPAPASATPAQPTNTPATGDDDLPDFVRDPKKAFEYIKELRKEAGDHRKTANDFKSRLEVLETEAKKKAEAELAANQKFEQLAQQYKAELEAERANAKAATLQALRVKIGAEVSLPAALIERLQGDTEEEIRKDAEALKAAIPAPAPQEPPGRPRSSTTPMPTGAAGETEAQKKARLLGRGTENVFSMGVVRHTEG